MAEHREVERQAVKRLGDAIGYGRVMQLAEQVWGDTLETKHGMSRGGAHAVGCCVAFLVPCQCARKGGRCDWCCGAGRVTKRVRRAQREAVKES